MPADTYFFDLPVYRISEEHYYQLIENRKEKQFDRMRARIEGYEPSEHLKQSFGHHIDGKYGPWQFNEIIAYIRLHFLGSQIRGEYFSSEKQRNGLNRKKVFTFRTWKLAPEVDLGFARRYSNQGIWSSIQEYVALCKKELSRSRVIDDSILNTIGPHMDWVALLDKRD
ncbi:hypothetical protein [Celeribacter sp.]|uniref:hypothetical protein n=1 Tax=Celeribacter sp. TaxID=1890673 RepID=UPI003A926A54